MNPSQQRTLDRRLARDPIAIVGLSALYPKARNLREYWSNVVAAADCTTEVPATHWDVEEFYDPDPAAPDKTYAKRGGFIPDVPFNPLEFGLPPNTLEVTDVLQLLSLVVTRDLLKDAGADREWYDPSRTGVVLGITGANQLTQPLTARLQSPVLKEVVRSCGLSDRDAEEIAAKFRMAYAPWEENSFPGMLGNVVAGRIANRFDLGGINMTIDAACASSLGAVRTAVSELLEGRADTMLAGGCDAENTIFMYLCFSKTPALSKSGRIRPFDRDADGTLIGEGIGMLALRRLADAERDGNRIYAVLRGLGTSSDGRFKSIYAPRKEGQMTALRRAYQDADVAPDSIELFEAHGTGTAVGDATEISALTEVVAKDGGEREYAAIGSVKSQIGHTKAAAGAAGLIKLALALEHKVLPPTINVDRAGASFGPDSPFYVNSATRPWIRDPKRPHRRAAVSAFGFGGTNFHAVLEEYGDGDDVAVRFPVARVHLWHAPDPEALAEALAAGRAPDGGPVPDGHARVAFAARDEADAEALRATALAELRSRPDAPEWTHPKGIHYRRSAGGTGRVGALFAGQGSQYVAPGLSAVLALPPLRSSFDRANRHFPEDTPLSRVAFPQPLVDEAGRAAQEAALRATAYAQPAIGALSAGHFRYLTELGFAAEGFLGHSFGELTALYAAGAYDEDTLHRLARARGSAMSPASGQADDTGTMAAVFAPEERVAELLSQREGLLVCNRNAPDQIVVGGATAEVELLLEAAERAGVRARRLPVSAAFHTPFVGHAVEDFRTAVESAEMSAPRGRVYANTAGAVYGPDVAANRRVLAEQLIHPVEFAARVEEMYADGFRTFVEFGPGTVLTGLVGRILRGRPHTVVALDGGPGRDADLTLKQAVARLAVLGLPISTGDRYVAEAEPEVPAKGMTVMLNGINYVSPQRRAAYQDALANGYRVPATVAAPATVTTPGTVTTPDTAAAPASTPVTAAAFAPAPASPAPVTSASATAPRDPVPEPPRPAGAPEPGRAAQERAGRTPVPPVPDHPRPAQENEPMPSDRLTELISDHLSLHDEYLHGQLRSAERMARLLERADDQGRLDQVMPGISSVKEHGLAIGRTHIRANEVLRSLAGLELGAEAPAPDAAPAPAVPARTEAAPAALPEASRAPAEPALPAPPLPEPAVAPALPATWTPAPAQAPAPAAPAAPAPAAPTTAAPTSAAGPDADTVRTVLLDIVADKTGYPADMLDPTMDIEADLGIDSIKRVEIMGALQEHFATTTTAGPEQLAELRTLADIVTFVADASTGTAPAAPAPAAPTTAAGPDADTVRTVLLDIVADKTGYPADMLDPTMDIEADLGIDSIKRVEIMGALQEHFATTTTAGPEQLAELRTLADIVTFVADASTGTAPTAPAPAAPTTAAGPDADTVRTVLLDIVADKTGYPADMLDPTMDIEADLGIDSIKRVEIMGALQEHFATTTTAGPEQLAELRTLADIVTFVADASTGTAPTAPAPAAPTTAAPTTAAGPDADTVRTVLLDIVADKTGYPADMLDPTMDIEADLGIDSIKRVEIMGALQEHFATTTTAGPEQLAELRTLADIVTFVADASTGTAPTAPAPAAPTTAAPTTAAGPDADTVRTVLLDIVADKTGYPADMLDPTMDIEADLGIDSIKRVEIMGALQEHFATTTTAGPEQLAELRTLADIVDFVAGVPRVAGRESVAGGAEAQGASSGEDHPPEPVLAVHPAQASDRAARIGRAHAALVELSLPDPLLDAYAPDHGALVVDDGSQLAAHLVERLTGTGRRVHTLRLPGVPARSSDVSAHPLTGWGTTELAAQIEEIFTDRIALVVDVTAEHRAEWAEGTRRLAHSLLLARHVVGPLSAAAEHGRAGFLTVTRLDGAFGLTGVAEEQVPAGGVAGLVKTLALEAPALFCRAVDLSPALDAATGAALLLDEAADSAVEPVQVGLDGTRRVGLTAGGEPLAGTDPKGPADAEVPAPSSEDVLVVTGGARGITATCVVELARRYRPELLLLGRTPLAEEPEWAHGVPDAGLKAAAAAALTAAGEKPTPKKVGRLAADVAGSREIRGTLDALRAAGSRAEYLAVDITDQSATAAVLAPYRDRITGLVHGAGVLADQLIAHKKASEIERVFAPKLTGLRSLTAVLPAERLRHVVLFSSVAGFFGNQGQSDYAMANEVLNAWAASARRRLPHARVTSLNWGAWDSGMVSPQIKAVFEERGIPLIQAADGARLFAEQFAPERAADTVTVLGPTTPLSSRERPAVTAPATVRRSLAALERSPLVADHTIDAVPVLPAAVAVGWALGAVEHAEGRPALRLRDFTVHKGIVFDGTQAEECRLVMTPGDGEVKVAVRSAAEDGSVRPHYAATVPAGVPEPAAPLTGLPAPGTGEDAAGLYDDGTLFHGPALRGLRRVLAAEESRLVLECEPVALDTATAAGSWYAAGPADLLLQAALVWVRRFRSAAGLPLAVGGVDLYAPLTAPGTFLVVVEPVRHGGPDSRLTVTACTPDGRVLARFTDVSVVSAPQLAAKFAS